MKKSLFVCSVFCLCLTGCATVKDTLGYAPVIEQQKKNDIALCVNTFEDVRSDKKYIGEIRDLFGIPVGEITTEDNVPNWIRNALKLELTNAGYSILDASTTDNYLIEGKIIKVFTKGRFGHRGYMTVEISLKKGDEVLFQKTYDTAKKDGLGAYEYASCTEVLKYNLQEVCRNFISDANQHLLKLAPKSAIE